MGLFFNKKLSPAEFWAWFSNHSAEYQRLEENQDQLINQLSKQLGRVDPVVGFLIGPVQDGRREFILSCDGVRRNMPRVQAIEAVAPEIPGWQIIAFKPPHDIETAEYGGKTLNLKDIYFTYRVEEDLLDIVLFVDGYIPQQRSQYMAIGFIFLDSLLGELGVMNKLGKIELAELASADRSALTPLKGLTGVIKKNLAHSHSSTLS